MDQEQHHLAKERYTQKRMRHWLGILRESGHEAFPGARILDLGCGEGYFVKALRNAGYDAWGCDVEMRKSPHAKEMIESGHIRPISMEPYRVPFEDAWFDFVCSDEVLEHVMNYPDFISENRRVLKPSGVSLHIFPGPYMPIEGHTYVPLAAMHRSYPWLLLWASTGIRNPFQKGYTARRTAQRNYKYLREQTNYVTTADVRRLFGEKFKTLEFREDLFLRLSESKRARWMNRAVRAMPFLLPVYRNMHNRVMIAHD
jgi:SAM-dependent methyltransferase